MKLLVLLSVGLLVQCPSSDGRRLEPLLEELRQLLLNSEVQTRGTNAASNGGSSSSNGGSTFSNGGSSSSNGGNPSSNGGSPSSNGRSPSSNGGSTSSTTPMGRSSRNNNPISALSNLMDDEIFPDNPGSDGNGLNKRNLGGINRRWPQKKVPYVIDTSKIPNTADHDTIREAIQVMSDLTCVQFLPRTDALQEELGHDKYISFTVVRGCTSYVGMYIPEQPISLGPGCIDISVILHEMLHAIGFSHEQDRSDRDHYIRMTGSWIGKTPQNTENYAPYDLQSIMQYSLKVGGELVMETIDPNQAFLIKARKPNTLQFYDVMDVIGAYECASHCTNTQPCLHGGFLNHKCECFCPDHLSGGQCESVVTDSGCGGIFDINVGQEVSIGSPNYPNNYAVNTSCHWLFKGKAGYHLRMTIDEMHMPYNYLDRCYHWLEIHYGNVGQPGVLRCGEASGLSFTTSRDSPELLLVGFDSKTHPDRTPEKGFSFTVYLVGDHCLDNPCNYGVCKETGSGYQCECESGFTGQHCDQVQANQKIECNFDSERPCIFTNTDTGDQFDFYHSKFRSSYLDTGPRHARSGEGFLLADMSPPRSQGDVAHLVTAFPLPAEERCLSFYYNMYGDHVESLVVKSSSNGGGYSTIWSMTGNQGPKWQYAQVDLPSQDGLHIRFEAMTGLNYSSAIALDDIQLTPGVCVLNPQDDVVYVKTMSGIDIFLNEYDMTFNGIGWINFEVHGCNDAFVTLYTSTKSKDDSYRLGLGLGSNTWGYLQKYVAGEKTVNLWTIRPILDCDKYTQFWLGWKDNKLQLGTGFIYGQNVVMSGIDDSPLDVVYVSISSNPVAQWRFIKGNCISGYWKCQDTGYCLIPDERCDNVEQCGDGTDEQNCVYPKCSDDEFRCTYGRCLPGEVKCDGKNDCSDNSDELDCPIRVTPHSSVSLSTYGYNPSGQTSLKISAMTCSDAWITLLSQGQKIYQAGIGRGGNAWSSLERVGGSTVTHSGVLLDCSDFLPFYVSWAQNYVQVGQGHEVGEKIFLNLQDDAIPAIDEVELGSYAKDVYYNIGQALPPCDASTEFRCGFGRCIPISDRCDGAPHCTDGSDEKDCPILVPAWGDALTSEYKYNISGYTWLNFQVKGCANAFVRLMESESRIFYVMLGRGNDEWSSLHSELNTDRNAYKTKPVLDCDTYKSFWFSWTNGQVQVGEGLFKGENLLFEIIDESPVNIDDVQLASYSTDNLFQIRQGNCFEGLFQCTESEACIPPDQRCDGKSDCAADNGSDEQECIYPTCDADTEFRCEYGRCYPKEIRCNEVVECSDGSDEFECPILTNPHQSKSIADYDFSIDGLNWVNFYVKSCADAHILLEVNDQVTYEVLLGRGGDTWSSMSKTDDSVSTWASGSVLNCTEYLPFWVSWKNGDIKVGMGLNRNENTYMSFTDPGYVDVTGVLVKSYAVQGEWFFESGNCFPGMFHCSENNNCIPVTEECNGQSDCAASGGSDEQQCAPCSADEFQCAYGRCLAQSKRCDDQVDCWDRSDEKNCPVTVPVLWVSSYYDIGQHGISGTGRDTLVFTSNACADAWIGLFPDKADTSLMYAIGLGRGGNTFNSISKNGSVVKSSYIVFLDCSTKTIWVTWKDGRIAAGTGTDVTQNVLVEWVDSDPLVVNDIGLSSWSKTWIFQNIDV